MKELAFFKGTTSPKRTTIKKKPIMTEPSVRDKIAQRRKSGNWSNTSITNSTNTEDTTTAAIPDPAKTSMGPKHTNLIHDRRKKKGFPKLLKRFRDYYQEKGIQ